MLLIEEPELYLSPHAQRHLYSVLRALAQAGNQILYSTHAPVFLSVDRLEELALVRHTPTGGTSLHQPEPLGGGGDASARCRSSTATAPSSSSRAARSSSRAARRSSSFPLVFDALGVDADKEGILVLECGGKGNMPLFARVCNACDVPYVVVHDRDAPRGKRPVESERVVNRQIREVAAAGGRSCSRRTSRRSPASGPSGRGRKPQKAWQRYRGNGDVPEPCGSPSRRSSRSRGPAS